MSILFPKPRDAFWGENVSLVPLTAEEWSQINSTLSDVTQVCDRIQTWSGMEYITTFNVKKTNQLRLSQVCFRDAAYALYNARYAFR